MPAKKQRPAHERIAILERALRFYADIQRYQGPNQPRRQDDQFGSPNDAYMIDVTRDYGTIAREALDS